MLGPLELRDDDGRPVEIGGSRLRALLIRLALHPGAIVTVEALIDGLWGEEPPSGALNALQSLVSRLRRALPSGGPGAALIQSHPAGYRLAVAPDHVDAHRFERLAARGRAALAAGEYAEAAAVLRTAEDLWRGPALADAVDAPFAEAAAARLAALRLSATEDRLEADLACGRHADALAELERLAAAHPLRERLQGQAMRALYAVGRQADALATYERVRGALADELGVDPGAELADLHLAVLRQDPKLLPAIGSNGSARAQEPASDPDAGAEDLSHDVGERGEQSRTNLRVPLTSFVGRDAELRSLGKLLTEERLVTVVGSGGAGKTRLALELAARTTPRPAEETWFVELAAIAEPGEVPQAVLSTLGVRDLALLASSQLTGAQLETVPVRDPVTVLVEAFRAKQILLILDNCEHLVDAAAALTDRLLGACPGLRVLATSREQLGVPGERLYPIPPLGLPPEPELAETNPDGPAHGLGHPVSSDLATSDQVAAALAYPAVRLFADRAVAVRPEFEVTPDTLGSVVEICRRLDGIPLAIELAAARLRSLSVGQIAARLDDRFRLLTAGRRTVLARHQTLRAVVEWSWDLLDEPERILLRRLAVFHGGATLEFAELICADDVDCAGDSDAPAAAGGDLPRDAVLDVLAALVDKSLVDAVLDRPRGGFGDTGTGEVRYRLLETVRAYGLERLTEAGESQAMHAAHAQCFARLVEEGVPYLRGGLQVEWMARLRAEHDNVLAAMRTAVDSGNADLAVRLVAGFSWFWFLEGHRAAASNWTRAALGVPGDAPPGPRALLLMLAGFGYLTAGDPDACKRSLREALALVDAPGSRIRDEFPELGLLESMALTFEGDGEAGRRRLEAVFPALRPWGQAMAKLFLGNMEDNAGDTDAAEAHLLSSLDRFTELGDRWGRASALRSLAGLWGRAGGHARSISAREEALALLRELGSDADLPLALTQIAGDRARSGDLAGARSDLDRARALVDAGQVPELAVWVRLGEAEYAIRVGDLAEARRHAELARADLAGRGPTPLPMRIVIMAGLGLVLAAAGAVEVAADVLRDARGFAANGHDRPMRAMVVHALAAVAYRSGDTLRAASLMGVAEAVRGGPDRSGADPGRTAEEARSLLGAEAYDAEYARGAAMSDEEIVALLAPSESSS
ncbi:Predicted ATPase [Actinopolymorpha cephalotaxi]|nr:BTAD domain-containing putative transcriptional regulator [Actinopolymorpha cephalotaxi]SFH53255.1 Predicted ATPase [Actinopolymorpha cephalotaxi]